MAEKLVIGDAFPPMTLSLAGGGTLALPAALGPKYGVAVFYRGHW
jgi:hypothetical protein